MIRMSLQMKLTHEGADYRLQLNETRPYGREPMTGELIHVGGDEAILLVHCLGVTWSPDYCSIDVEPAHDAIPLASTPASSLAEIQQFVNAGFRCPWTGYPDGVTLPND